MKNGFVVGCERTHEAIVIDPGDEVDQLLAAVRDYDLQVQHILLTHAHIDHITGVAAAQEALAADVFLHADDLFLYDRAVEQGAMFGFKVQQPPKVDVFYDMTPITFGDYEVLVHHTPGHCPGGVCLQVRGKGDGGPGRIVRRRHPVCRVHRPDGPAGRQLRSPDAVDYRRDFSAGRRCGRPPWPRPGYDGGSGADDESLRPGISREEDDKGGRGKGIGG